uniref:Putative molecular chaperone n=1 Tax=Ixodes ricinus TaxID=34613 RepID=A0A0K8RC74_IXORI
MLCLCCVVCSISLVSTPVVVSPNDRIYILLNKESYTIDLPCITIKSYTKYPSSIYYVHFIFWPITKKKTDLLLHRKLPRIFLGFGVVISKRIESFICDMPHFFSCLFPSSVMNMT